MARSKKDDWLESEGDLREADVDDVPVKGKSVRVRALPGAYSNRATSEATEMVQTAEAGQTFKVNVEKLEVLKFSYGCVDPKFSPEEAQVVAEKFGPAFNKVVTKIDQLSGTDAAAVEAATARFPSVGTSEGGSDVDVAVGSGDDRSPVPARVG